MNFVLRTLGVGGASIPNFNVTIGETLCTVQISCVSYTLKTGTRNEDKTPVTIFEAPTKGMDEATVELYQNAQQRAKTLKLPGFLRCLESAFYNGTFYFATEECVPLSETMSDRVSYYEDEDMFDQSIAFGVDSICKGLICLHRNNLLHGNVNFDSIFVLKSGEWKMFGLEFVSDPFDEQSIFRRNFYRLASHRQPPELTAAAVISTPAVHTTDAWGVAVLLYETFSKTTSGVTAQDIKKCKRIPEELHSGFTALASVNPKLRMSLDKFIADTDFIAKNPFVNVMTELEELSLKDMTDRDNFYRKMAAKVDTFPLRACKYVILPKLSTTLQYGGGSAAALEPVLRIGSRLEPEEFSLLVAPVVVLLFSSTDHLIRCRLLSTAEQYAKLLPAQLVSEKIWPQYALGFGSKSADLRELSVRSLVHFAPLLNENIMGNDVFRYITQLQQDREGPIRTNATICLGLIAPYIPSNTRTKTLVNGFGRMLKDPFVPSRVAAVRSISSTLDCYTIHSIAETLLPVVSPLTIDPVQEVRHAALKAVHNFLSKIEEHNTNAPPDQQQGTEGTAHARTSSDVEQAAPGNSGGGWGLFSWGSKSSSATTPQQPPSHNSSQDTLEQDTPKKAIPQQPPSPSSLHNVPVEESGETNNQTAKHIDVHQTTTSTNNKAQQQQIATQSSASSTTTSNSNPASFNFLDELNSQPAGGLKLQKGAAKKRTGFGGASKLE